MSIPFKCPKCETQLEATREQGGSLTECPACNESIEVPIISVVPGSSIGGFQIVRAIGSGGMGSIFLAKQESMGRMVALKVLNREVTQNESASVETTRHDARLMSSKNDTPRASRAVGADRTLSGVCAEV